MSELEELEKCPICGERMFVNEKGKLQCPALVYHQMDRKLKQWFKGGWSDRKNMSVTIRWNRQPIEKGLPTCDFCGEKVSAKEIKNTVERHHISYAAYAVNQRGEYHQKLGELYEKIRKRKISLEQAFQEEGSLNEIYIRKPSQEAPVSLTSGNVPLECPKCRKKMGLLEVKVEAKPELMPDSPSILEYVKLPLTAEQERIASEYFEIKGSIREWLEANELRSFIKELEATKQRINKLPYMRLSLREVNDFRSKTYTLVEALEREVRTRSDQLYTFLKNPPSPRVSPTADLLEKEKREEQRGKPGFSTLIRRR